MKRVTALIFPLLLCLTGCNGQAKRDSAALDSILASQRIDVIEFLSPTSTNTVTGEEVHKLIASFKTNRIAHTDWSKQPLQEVRLLSGTNDICHLSLGEDGTWGFGSYEFRVRQ